MKFFLAALLALCAIPLQAQTQTFALSASGIALPGGKSTLMGSVSGMALTVTNDFDLREDNVISGDTNLTAFLGGFNYRLPALSKGLNNMSTTLNGYNFQFYITASVGVDRIASPGATTVQHYAFLAGGGLNYKLTSGGAWTLGAEVRYAKLPGYANNTAIVSVGPSFHW